MRRPNEAMARTLCRTRVVDANERVWHTDVSDGHSRKTLRWQIALAELHDLYIKLLLLDTEGTK